MITKKKQKTDTMASSDKAINSFFRSDWLILALALLGIGMMVAANLYIEHGRTEARESNKLATQANVIAENMALQLGSINLALMDIRDEFSGQHTLSESGNTKLMMGTIVNAMPGVRTISVFNAEGVIVDSNRPEIIGKNLSYRDYFKTVQQSPNTDTLYVSAPFKTLLGTFGINISLMLPGAQGEFAGIVSGTLEPDYFKTLLSSVLYTPDMWSAIAHGDGLQFLMVPERKDLEGINLAQPGSFFTRHRDSGQAVNTLTGTAYSTGERRMMALHTVNPARLNMDKPLVVTVNRDLDAVFTFWRRDVWAQVGLYGVFIAFSIAGLCLYHRWQFKFKQLEAEAFARVERFRVALDHIPSYIYMKDTQSHYIYANRATLELFGCTLETLQGKEDTAFFPPDTVAHIQSIDTRVLQHGEDTSEEVSVLGEDGIRRVYLEIKTPTFDDAENTRISGLCGISSDITELKQRERALQESQQRFQATFDFAAVGMTLVDLDGYFTQVNAALCNIVGYSEAELLQKTFQSITHPDDLDTDLAFVQELASGSRDSYQMEKRYFHKQGHIIWILLSGSAVRDSAGKTLYFIAQIQDITQFKQDQAMLLENEQRLQFVLRGSQVGFWDWNIKTNEVMRDQQWAEMLGYRLDDIEFSIKQWLDFVHPDDRDRAWQSIRNHLEGLTPMHEAEYRMRTKDGHYKWILDRAQVVAWDAEKKPSRMCGTHTDITGRKENEAALIESETRMRTLFENTSDAVMMLDENGFFDCNQATLLMFGCATKDIFVSKRPADLSPPKQADDIDSGVLAEQYIRQAMQEGSARFDWIHQRFDNGQVFDAEVLLNAITFGGKNLLQAVVRDITERKRLLLELERQAHIDFLTGVSGRGYFMQQAEQELARTMRYGCDLSIFMLDIDHFKLINDTYGHKGGDLVLKKLAIICQQVLREVDIVGRVGGEEFAVLLPETDKDQAIEVAERLREAIASTEVAIENGLPVRFTVSIGVTSLKGENKNLDVLLNSADKALYQAKNSGRNKVVAG
ncbi:MAG: PAS domain S-box protein [Methylobacter sp.]